MVGMAYHVNIQKNSNSEPASLTPDKTHDQSSLLQFQQVLNELSNSWYHPNVPISKTTQEYHFTTDEIIQAVELFFDQLLYNANMSQAVQRLMTALQVPIMKVTAQNPQFLSDHQHPARRLIKAVFIRSSRLNNNSFEKTPLFHAILAIVKSVEHDFQGDEGVFLKAYFDVCHLSF